MPSNSDRKPRVDFAAIPIGAIRAASEYELYKIKLLRGASRT